MNLWGIPTSEPIMRIQPILFVASLSLPLAGRAQSLYFPPLTGTAWDTLSPSTLGWCPDRIDSLYDFLEQKNTKGFIVLKDGRIVLEKYFGTFEQDSLWYWASAGKTLTAFLIGQAQEQGHLDIDDSTSHHLGAGWTSCTAQQEGAITIRDQLTMTSGLDDGVFDPYCTIPACLQYEADAGTRWAYHNAPYTLLREVIQNATGMTDNQWTFQQVGSRIGMYGLWVMSGWNNLYLSTTRHAARYGLLLLNRGIWDTDTLLHDTAYFNAMTTSSQALNESYGYLTWLNGQPSFMVPGLQFQFPGSLIPNAPPDMFMALGKNDQKIHVVPSRGMVVVRFGNSADTTSLVPIMFDNQLWAYMNALECGMGITPSGPEPFSVHPNPSDGIVFVHGAGISPVVEVMDAIGRIVLRASVEADGSVDLSAIDPGSYHLRIEGGHVPPVTLLVR